MTQRATAVVIRDEDTGLGIGVDADGRLTFGYPGNMHTVSGCIAVADAKRLILEVLHARAENNAEEVS